MTHLEILKEAYDKYGVLYVVREESSWVESCSGTKVQYLFLTNDKGKESLEKHPLDDLLNSKSYLEFWDGMIASSSY